LDKGSKVAVEGKLRTSSWDDKEGNTRKRTEIIADKVEFLSKKENGVGQQQARPEPSADYGNDGIPF
jgi:single-strand DNA-binding protein